MLSKNDRAKKIAIIIGLLIYLIIYPIYFRNDNYLLNIVITSTILSIISLGVWMTFSIQRINIGQGAFALIGGYTTAILITKLNLSFWICLPLSGLVAALIGLLIGIPILRLRGIYFAMTTLAFTKFANLLFLNGGDFTQGAAGIMNIPKPKIAGHLFLYYFTAFLLLVFLLLIYRMYQSRWGGVIQALRQSDTLAQSIGIDIVKYRLIVYCICCFIGGIGGSLFTIFVQNIFPANFAVRDSVNYMVYCFLGGLNNLLGPIVGTFILNINFELLRPIQKYQELINAIIIILLILWLPNGMLSLRFNRKAYKRGLSRKG